MVKIVEAVCADYERREPAIKYSNITGDTLEQYVELNSAVDTGLEAIEPGVRHFMLDDICNGRGYDYSFASQYMAKNSYYTRKKKIVFDIAKSLHLIP